VALVLALAAGAGRAQAAQQIAPLRDAARHVAASLQAMYAGINAAALEIYFANALLDPARPVGDTEPCLRTDNTLSTIASPLAATPFPEASIAQRARLAESLAAYMQAVGALAGDAPPPEVAADIGDLDEAIGRLKKSVAVHLERDLAIATPVATLAASAAIVSVERPRGAALDKTLSEANPAIVALIDILAKDVSARHAEALASAGAAYTTWSASYDRVRRLALAGAARTEPPPAIVRRCAAPYGAQEIPQRAADAVARTNAAAAPGTPPIDAQADAATLGIRLTVLERLRAAHDRYEALKKADPAAPIDALRGVDDTLLRFVRQPGDGKAAADLQTATAEFRAEAESAYEASFSARPR
jgi:hypothetical protein